jgi:superfamily II DNA helicase RecQ
MFRRSTPSERAFAQAVIEELRPVDYKATGTLQRSLDPAGKITRDDFDAILDAMTRSRLIAIEDAEYEKDGEVRRYRKVRLTKDGLATRSGSQVELLISDGITEEFASAANQKRVRKISKSVSSSLVAKESGHTSGAERPTERQADPRDLSAEGEALAARLKQWRTSEAKRLRVPPYCVLHDRTLTAVALARPTNPRQLLDIDGIGPAKVEKFGAAILELCTNCS